MTTMKRTFLKRIGALASAFAIAAIGSGCNRTQKEPPRDDQVSASVTAEDDAVKTELETSGITVAETGDKSAVDTALNYLTCMTFSRRQLIEQLRFDSFSTEEASYAKEDALEQMQEYDGFTQEQAEYGVAEAGF